MSKEKVDYTRIDAEMREVIWLLNKIPTTETYYSCFGHGQTDAYVMFKANWPIKKLKSFFHELHLSNKYINGYEDRYDLWELEIDNRSYQLPGNNFIFVLRESEMEGSMDGTAKKVDALIITLLKVLYQDWGINILNSYDIFDYEVLGFYPLKRKLMLQWQDAMKEDSNNDNKNK